MTGYLTIFCPITGHKSCCSAVLIWSVIRKIVPIFSNEYIFYWFCTNIFPILFLYFCSRNSYIPIYLKPVIAWRPGISKFCQKCILALNSNSRTRTRTLLRSLLILGWIDPWCSVLFLISNLFILPKFASHYSFASVCIYLVRPLPVSAAHSTWHRTYTDSFMHADSVAPSTVKQSSFIFWWDHRSSMSHRLSDLHWIL